MARIETWPEMRLAYVTGIANEDGTRRYPSMAEIADQFGVSLSSVTHIAGAQRWAEERSDFQRRVYESTISQFEDEFSRVLARADLDAAIAAADLIHAVRRQVERATDQERVALSKTISRPLRELIDIVHRAVGIEQVLAESEVDQRPAERGEAA